MAPAEQQNNTDDLPEAVIEGKSKGLPVVWLLPIVALLVGAWLVYKTLSEKGPEISISFQTAEGIEEGKTQVKLKDVKVGIVDSVEFSHDLSQVLVKASLVHGADPFLTDKTRFWVVRPRIGAGEVSGLGTLVSGAYIAMDPDNTGKSTKRFVGLEKPPVITADRKGTSYRLRAERVGSLSIGSPIYFRQFGVGEVTDYKLSDDHSYIDVGIFIESPHDQFVREGTHFWNASGVDVSLSAAGVNLEMESLVSLLGGGIAFETLPAHENTLIAKAEHTFVLYPNHAKSLEQPITEVTRFALKFSDTVRGLEVGAPVEFRGIRMGTVKAIELGSDPSANTLVPVVIIDFEPQRLQAYDALQPAEVTRDTEEILEGHMARVRRQVEEHGLRARLQTGNLVTGKLFVDFDLYPNAPPATIDESGKYPELPTMPGSLEGILAGVQQLLDKLEKANLEETLTNLNQLMVSTSNLMSVLEKDTPELADELYATLTDARSMLKDAALTMKTVNAMASPDGEIGNQLNQALREISAAARSIRVMAEYLERHPDAMLKGKGTR